MLNPEKLNQKKYFLDFMWNKLITVVQKERLLVPSGVLNSEKLAFWVRGNRV